MHNRLPQRVRLGPAEHAGGRADAGRMYLPKRNRLRLAVANALASEWDHVGVSSKPVVGGRLTLLVIDRSGERAPLRCCFLLCRQHVFFQNPKSLASICPHHEVRRSPSGLRAASSENLRLL
jgi:hypothetical protein